MHAIAPHTQQTSLCLLLPLAFKHVYIYISMNAFIRLTHTNKTLHTTFSHTYIYPEQPSALVLLSVASVGGPRHPPMDGGQRMRSSPRTHLACHNADRDEHHHHHHHHRHHRLLCASVWLALPTAASLHGSRGDDPPAPHTLTPHTHSIESDARRHPRP